MLMVTEILQIAAAEPHLQNFFALRIIHSQITQPIGAPLQMGLRQ